MPITLNGDTGITTPTYGGANTAEYLVPVTAFKNRIINGAMVIDQRNAGASVTPINGQISIDRWQAVLTQASKFTIQQNAGSVTPPAGFTNYLGITSTSAYSVLTGDTFVINQLIEGFNVADLGFGTANAKTITLSFWVRSSLTGSFGGAILNSATNRSYTFSYTISSANTWEQKSITIAGDTTGTWLTNNGIGMYVRFGLGSGSTYTQTAGSWGTANAVQPPSTTSVVGTNGATFYITGVQLEVGSTATSFDYRPYGTELALCQRYFYLLNGAGQAAGAVRNTTDAYFPISFPVDMRSTPTATLLTSSVIMPADFSYAVTAISTFAGSNRTLRLSATIGSASLVAGYAVFLQTGASNTDGISFSAEL